MEITPLSKVGEVLERYPQTEAVFTRLGFTELQNPLLRQTVAKFATLEMASRNKKFPLKTLIEELKTVINEAGG